MPTSSLERYNSNARHHAIFVGYAYTAGEYIDFGCDHAYAIGRGSFDVMVGITKENEVLMRLGSIALSLGYAPRCTAAAGRRLPR